jgi:hypothetical protein
MDEDRPARGQRPTRNPKAPYSWSKSKKGDVLVTIERGQHSGKQGVVQRYGFEAGGDMVYLINLTNGSNIKVVVWPSDTTIVVDKLAQPGPSHSATIMIGQDASGARWCMVAYGGVSLC